MRLKETAVFDIARHLIRVGRTAPHGGSIPTEPHQRPDTGLALSQGFVTVGTTLQSSDPLIFAAGAMFVIWPNPLTYILAVMLIGARQLGLAILMHDAAHGALRQHPHRAEGIPRGSGLPGLVMLGQDVGAPRLPLQPLDAQGSNHLKSLLVALAN